MAKKKPMLRTDTLDEATRIVANMRDWTSQPPPGRASFGGWIHEGQGELRVAQGWKNLGLLLLELGQVLRDGDGYRVYCRNVEALRQHLNQSRHYEREHFGGFANCAPADVRWDEESGEWVYNDRASRIRAAAKRYKASFGCWPTTSTLQELGYV